MTDTPSDQRGRAPAWRAALFGLCPQCEAATLFEGPVHFSNRCSVCGADFSQQNVGDGPAAFLTMIVGGLVVALAMLVEVWIYPPFWVHVLLWVPFTVAAVLLGLRAAKGALFHAEWHRKAGEGRQISETPDND